MDRKSNQFYWIDLDGEPINHPKNSKQTRKLFSVLSPHVNFVSYLRTEKKENILRKICAKL